MIGDEAGALGCSILGVLDEALPFEDCPAIETVSGELGEDRTEIDLSVTGTTEAPGALRPWLVAAIRRPTCRRDGTRRLLRETP
jgi:hypothetical protein